MLFYLQYPAVLITTPGRRRTWGSWCTRLSRSWRRPAAIISPQRIVTNFTMTVVITCLLVVVVLLIVVVIAQDVDFALVGL